MRPMSWALGLAASVIALTPAIAQERQGIPIMMYGYDGFGWGHTLAGFFMMVLFWGGLIAVIYLAVKWLSADEQPRGGAGRKALNLLEERFARGEIDKDEFLERKRHLTE